jgi:hypothetical protein
MPAFVPVHPPRNPDECSPWLYEALTRLNRAATGAGQAAAAVVRGEVPDSSGNALPAPDLSGYFLLAGRSGGQIARGDTVASGILTLVSTANATKGFIYFGSAQTQAAFDEAQGFFGFGTVAPSALVHIKGSGSLLKMEATGVTHTCNGTSGDMILTATDTGFDPSGSTATVTAGMAVTGTNVAPNTFVRHVHSNTTVSLTVALTGTITGGTITFTNSGLFRRTIDETATDVDFFTQGGIRLTAGSSAPLRIISDQLDDSNVGIVTGAVCSAVNGTRTLTASGSPFANVLDNAGAVAAGYAAGDLITGSGIPEGTYVVTKVTSSQLTLSNTLPTITTQVMTFKRQNNYSLIEVGTIVSAAAIGANLQIGGPNRGELALFTLSTNRGWIKRQSGAGATMIGLGYTANPHDFTTAWTGLMSVEPITVQNADFTIGGAVGGTAPNKTLSASVYLYVQSSTGRVYIGGTATGAYFTPGTNDQIACFQTTSDLNLFTVSHVQAWSDSLAAASSFRVLLGDLNSTHRAVFVSSQGNGVFTRFGLSSLYTLITNGQAGGGADFPAPPASNVPILLVSSSVNNGSNSAPVMKIQTLRSGQTGDMLQILDSTPKVTASVSASGVVTGTSADLFWEDDKVSWEDENVYYSALNP